MTSSLHVSLPDEMRAYVDLRTNGGKAYATPSEYVRALIREDMENDAEARYVHRELLKSAADIEADRLIPAKAIRKHMDNVFAELAADPAIGK